MHVPIRRWPVTLAAVCTLAAIGLTASIAAQTRPAASERSESNRPMTFLDVQHMRNVGVADAEP